MLEKIKENAPAILMALALVSGLILSEVSLMEAQAERKRIDRIRQLEYYNTPLGDHDNVRAEEKDRRADSPDQP